MTGAANPHRGEAVLMIGGQPLVLRPTFAALVAAEEELGPLFALVERASAGQLRLSEMVALFWYALRERNGLERDDFAEAVAREGLAACTPALRSLIVQILKGAG
ncbi:gene transfer agent family protein [Novosphingobium hassiacum]|nr:gene transfer agent family protein [Novosphingobium hassiacum]